MSFRWNIGFEKVLRNLSLGRYRGKISSADYSNLAIQPFQENKFASHLGFSTYELRRLGLIRIENNCGWNLPREPTVKELIAFGKNQVSKK